LFSEERKRIVKAVGRILIDVQHVGSTAVPGLPAKPIIDIAVALDQLETFHRLIEPLEKVGYRHMVEFKIPGEVFFRKNAGTYHLHVLELNSPYWQNYLFFRDYLRRHPRTAREYFELKKTLAARYPDDRPAYTRGKATFIESILHRARDQQP